jgi:dihydroorotase
MRILLKKARIIAPDQPLNGLLRDLLIEGGVISRIAEKIEDRADETVERDNLHVSPGWMDTFSNFCDPGFEYKEDLGSGAAAAAAGGFTEVMVIPNTHPTLGSKAQIEYIVSKSADLPVTIRPIGTISGNLEGKALAEMYEMHASGAVAFSDGLVPVQSSGLLLKGLQYVKAFGGILIQLPDDTGVSGHGFMNEGIWSTRLGMQGKPAIAEEIMIKRDVDLLRYTGSKLHFTAVSLGKSVDLIREAKAAGLAVSCSVTPYHLLLTDESLQGYDSNFKVNPPLREQKDLEALIAAVGEDVVDCFAIHHMPQESDAKLREFEYAAYGMIGLESAFGVLGKALGEISLEQKIRLLAVNPRKLFGLPVPQIAEKATASLTLFDPGLEWEFTEAAIRSRSRNTPFTGMHLKGKPFGIVHKGRLSR